MDVLLANKGVSAHTLVQLVRNILDLSIKCYDQSFHRLVRRFIRHVYDQRVGMICDQVALRLVDTLQTFRPVPFLPDYKSCGYPPSAQHICKV